MKCKYKTAILVSTILSNALLFVLVISIYPPVWYTNDDFRMMTIVSGAYTGTPCADIVFMRYPVGMLLSGLYSITTSVSWYGFFTMFCMFVPSCIFCYYFIKKAYEKNCCLVGIGLYAMLFVLIIQKYICMPQYTLSSAFMGVGAITLIYEMPDKKNLRHIILAVFCSVMSFSVRTKAFYLLIPVILLVIAVKIIKEKCTIHKYMLWVSVTLVLCIVVTGIDTIAWNRDGYQEFKEFKEVRAQIYDYDAIPGYYENMPFYVSNDIDEITYRAVADRFLDIDDSVNTENLTMIADYMKEIKTTKDPFIKRLKTAFDDGISQWFTSSDATVKYCAIYVLILLALCLTLSFKKKKLDLIFLLTVAGFVLEITYLKFQGRVMARLIDLMILAMAVTGTLTLLTIIDKGEVSFKKFWNKKIDIPFPKVWKILLICASIAIVFAYTCNMQSDLKSKSLVLRETNNPLLQALNDYASKYPDKFFFYDTKNFINCTNYVFSTVKKGAVINTESMGSWNARSPSYYARNRKFGFETSVDGLLSDTHEVYFVTRVAPKKGITMTLKDRYNKKLVEVDKVQTTKDILYVYMVVDDE